LLADIVFTSHSIPSCKPKNNLLKQTLLTDLVQNFVKFYGKIPLEFEEFVALRSNKKDQYHPVIYTKRDTVGEKEKEIFKSKIERTVETEFKEIEVVENIPLEKSNMNKFLDSIKIGDEDTLIHHSLDRLRSEIAKILTNYYPINSTEQLDERI
jgi:hypothetical protein